MNLRKFARKICQLFLVGFFAFAVLNVSAYAAGDIAVSGNSRVDAQTIKSYFSGTGTAEVNQGVKDLYATGLFSSVKTANEGGKLVVTVVENQIINRVAFEGNSKLKSAVLQQEIQSKSLGPFSEAVVQSDVERLMEIYKRAGRGDAKITWRKVDLPNGRLDVVFTIKEGDKTGIKTISFVGNKAYSEGKLKGLMTTTEMNFLSWFKNTDVYDPDRIASDQELIRRYYLRNGYADFRIVSTDAKFDAAQGGYLVTITVDEGEPYKVSKVSVDSHLKDVPNDVLLSLVKLSVDSVYDSVAVEKSIDAMSREVAKRGYAFSQIRPRGDKDSAIHKVALTFVVDEGPRVYVERINVRGNTRTRDYIIRREFDIGEGDPYNRVAIDRAERRLNNTGYFKIVRITNEPGSSPDRVVINVDVEDQPTGSFSIAGGYSTSDGLLAEVAVTETNFMGRGQFVRVAAQEGQKARGVDFSFTEPYFMDQRIAAGFDLFRKVTDQTKYSYYQNWVTGGTLRAGLPITEELTFQPRYSLYTSKIKIPDTTSQPYSDCDNPIAGFTPGYNGAVATSAASCLTNGEASLAVKETSGSRLTSAVGSSLIYNSLDNNKNPTNGILAEAREDVAGAGGNAHFIRSTGDVKYYKEIFDDIIGIARVQGGNVFGYGGNKLRIVDNFNLGPNLVRGFAPGGIGPRDVTDPNNSQANGLGGTTYFGGSLETQFPLPGIPREVGLKGALFADAGTLFGYKGNTLFPLANGTVPGYANGVCTSLQTTQSRCITVQDSHKIRTSVGIGLLWASPLGPIRFDYSFVLSKTSNDVTQAFRFSGGSSF